MCSKSTASKLFHQITRPEAPAQASRSRALKLLRKTPSLTLKHLNKITCCEAPPTTRPVPGCPDRGRPAVRRPDGDPAVRDLGQGQHQRGGDVQIRHLARPQVQEGDHSQAPSPDLTLLLSGPEGASRRSPEDPHREGWARAAQPEGQEEEQVL